MFVRGAAFRSTNWSRKLQTGLLAGVSALALVTGGQPAHAKGSLTIGSSSFVAPVTTAMNQAMVGAQQAQAMAMRAQNSLSRVTQALSAMQAMQTAARNLVLNASTPDPVTTNGLGAGGLVVDPRITAAGSSAAANLWVNANQPTQTVANGQTTVTVQQTAQNAVMTWQQFNVSKSTTVDFNQQGNQSWVALNRIDATGVPSQIEGQIKADGTVLLINPNGIIFTGTSQINVHALVASSMDIDGTTASSVFNGSGGYVPVDLNGVTAYVPPNEAASNLYFAANGLYTVASANANYGNSASFALGNQVLATTPGRGAIAVQAGASMTTTTNSTGDGGYVALLGPSIINAGAIATPDGQILLSASNNALLTDPAPASTGVNTAISLGANIGPASTLTFPSRLPVLDPTKGDGAIINTGLLTAPQGAVTIGASTTLNQLGVVEATTGVQRIGSLNLSASGAAIFGPASVTAILPDETSGTVPSGSASGLAPVISIAGGGGIDFQSGSLLKAPSAHLTLSTGGFGDVVLEPNATIDLSGLTDVQVPVTSNLVTFLVNQNDTANSPLADFLIGQTVTEDTRISGTGANGLPWIGSPILDASGYAKLIPESIDQVLVAGGSITVNATNFVQKPGSVLNVSGGYVDYTPGQIDTTRLLGSDGHLYDIGSAPTDISYVGMAGLFTVDHPHWGVTETYTSALISGGYYDAGYLAGASAGSLSIAATPALEGTIIGDTVAGERQLADAEGGGATAQASLADLPAEASLAITGTASAYLLESSAQAGSDPYGLSTYVFGGTSWTAPTVMPILTDQLSAIGFGSITIGSSFSTGGNTYHPIMNMAQGAVLTVAPGGSITLSGVETIDGTLNAAAGKIALTGYTYDIGVLNGPLNPTPLTLGADGVLNVAGLWVNDTGALGDQFQGSAFINAGSVSFSTTAAINHNGPVEGGRSEGGNVDVTQSIVLSAGSIIDLSGGGYVSPTGKFTGGAGGSLSLVTYKGGFGALVNSNSTPNYTEHPTGDNQPNTATVVMNGAIYADGFGNGGTFTLTAPTITIDGAATGIMSPTAGANSGTITLPTAFFTDNGFSSYSLTSLYGSTTVTAGTQLLLQQSNFLPSANLAALPTGSLVRDYAATGLLPDGLRNPVSLSLTQSAYTFGVTGPSTTAGVLIDQGASIIAEANASKQASITLTATGPGQATSGPITVLGDITAPGGSITLNTVGSVAAQNTAATDVWIGSDAVLDVSGVYVPNPTVTRYQTGSVINAGSISLSGATVVALPGSSFRLDGTSAEVQAPTGSADFADAFASQEIWSNGGTLTVTSNGGVGGAYFAGTMSAEGGAPLASGGTFQLNASSIVVEPGGLIASTLPTGDAYPVGPAELTASLPSDGAFASLGVSFIGADTLNTSGFENVGLKAGVIAFNGSESINLPGSLILQGTPLLLPASTTLLAPGVTSINGVLTYTPTTTNAAGVPTIGGATVDLTAGYISLSSSTGAGFRAPTLADGTLNVTAQWIDLGSPSAQGSTISLENVGQANFTSSGAIRLIGSTINTTGNAFTGALFAAGDLTLSAAEIYPASGTAFALVSTGTTAGADTLTINQTGAASQPLSAGGALVLDAANIDQNGTLWAPFGQILIGSTPGNSLTAELATIIPNYTGTAVPTQNVSIGAGSLTSVSGAGSLVPYGYTVNGQTWYVGDTQITTTTTSAPLYSGTTLAASPAKAITLSGANVTTTPGATLDLSGGGDVYASEFVSGTGGTQNVLAGPNVYALVPTSTAKVAAYDPTFADTAAGYNSSLLGATAGQAITIGAGAGIPAGTYTLMPGMYATLPGAYRVTIASTNLPSNAARSYTTADGSTFVAGTLANAITGAKSSGTALFEIQSQATWSKYSQINITSATSFLTAQATTAGTAPPNLPIDGGVLTLAATSTLSTASTNLFAPGTSTLDASATGVAGQVDISAGKILVLAADQTAPTADAGYLVLDADQVSNLGAGTVVIGGSSSINASGDLALVGVATNVEVESDAAHPLTGPELILVTQAGGSGITVDDGSVIAAKGTFAGGVEPSITIAGDGSLLRVSNGQMVGVTRTGTLAGTGSILIGTASGTTTLVASNSLGVTLNGGQALTIDSSGQNQLGSGVTLSAKAYDLSASIINVGGGTSGLVLSDSNIADFAGATSVLLKSASVINFYDANSLTLGDTTNPIGTLTFDSAGLYGQGGTTTVNAGAIVLTDSQATPNTAGALSGSATGTLTLNAGVIIEAPGAVTLGNLAQANFNASQAIEFSGVGSLNAGSANLLLAAPALVVNGTQTQGTGVYQTTLAAASQSVTTTGEITIASAVGTAPANAATNIGGSLALTGGSINDTGSLTALSGRLSLIATSGDITLGNGAVLTAAGSPITLGPVTEDTPGGTITLVSEMGNVTLSSGSLVNVAAAGNGFAGSLDIATAYTRTTTLAGTLQGGAAFKDLGGSFALQTGSVVGDLPFNSGFTSQFDVALYQPGDITVPTGVTLSSGNVLLVANQGSVIVNGTIDASGPTGGTIGLYGAGVTDGSGHTAGGVTINSGAQILANFVAPAASDPGYANGTAGLMANGGTITLGVTGYWDGASLNSDGSELIAPSASGTITIAPGAIINLSAGAGGTGGQLNLRAPITTDINGVNNVNVSVYQGGSDSITGASSLALNAYEVWSTTDPQTGAAGTHFDGIIDPAGWFNSDGTQIAGSTDPNTGIFTPTDPLNADHVAFYQTTLLSFVNSPFGGNDAAVSGQFGSGVQNLLHLRPEIDLYNPDQNTNHGSITVASNWNFGAGSIDGTGATNLAYRTTNGGEPGTLVLRAANDININATITDGFFVNYSAGGAGEADASTQYTSEIRSGLYGTYSSMLSGAYLQYSASGLDAWLTDIVGEGLTDFSGGAVTSPIASYSAALDFFGNDPNTPTSFALTEPTTVNCPTCTPTQLANLTDQYNQYYAEYLTMFRAYETEIIAVNLHGIDVSATANGLSNVTGGAVLSYSDFVNFMNNGGGSLSLAPSSLVIPAAPTLNGTYYNIQSGQTGLINSINFDSTGAASTSGTDYASAWVAYLFSVINLNLVDNNNGTLKANVSGNVPNLTNAPGTDANAQAGILAAVAVTPPYAPAANTNGTAAYISTTYVSSATVNPPPPADLIANNPAIYSVGNVAVPNTTSAASLMSASLGKSFSYNFVAGADFSSAAKAAVDPNAVISLAKSSMVDATNPTDSVVIGGNTAYQNPLNTGQMIYVPALVRTGTGSISLTAAGDVLFTDPLVQGAVYTAGTATDTPADFTAPVLNATYLTTPNGLVSTPQWGTGGGSVLVDVGQSIIGIGLTQAPDGTNTTQSVADWYDHAFSSNGSATPFSTACNGGCQQTAAWVNYATFFQNFGALGGGNITLHAGGDITDIAASLPETLVVAGGVTSADPAHLVTFGGGDLVVQAGGNLSSGVFFVGKGSGTIDVAGAVQGTTVNPITGASELVPIPNSFPAQSAPVLLQLYEQDGYISLTAGGAVTVKSLADPATTPVSAFGYPSYYAQLTSAGDQVNNWGGVFSSYGPQAGLSLTSLDGGVSAFASGSPTLPSSLSIVAPQGGITLGRATLVAYPTDNQGHDTGALTLAAGGSINLGTFSLNAPANTNPFGLANDSEAPTDLTTSAPVAIYAGQDLSGNLTVNRPAEIQAGLDISLTFTGENLTGADTTSIVAGRDIGPSTFSAPSTFTLYGPGALLIEAGRNIDIANGSGIQAIGNGSVVATNVFTPLIPYLPAQSANITTLFGVGPGVDYADTISQYVNPASAGTGGINFLTDIAGMLGQTPDQAWATFQSLPATKQQLLVDRAFLDFLTQVATDYRNSASPYFGQYARAYDAIDTLFPASYGYTNNATGGGANGAVSTATTGNLSMPYALIETQQGGDINILGPGGGIEVGSLSRDTLAPNKEGILTLAGGTISIFTDQTVDLNQSRIMTEQGGNVDMFSANGSLVAGSGPNTYVSNPVLSEICDSDGYCAINPAGLVTGAGIGAILTLPGQNPALSNVTLVAPHGTIDAGAAGIRVAGNLNIIALQVLNAYNINVGGTAQGIPTAPSVDVGGLTSASNAAGAAASAANNTARQPLGQAQPSIFIIEILGYGGGDGTTPPQSPGTPGDDQRRRQSEATQASYNPNSAFQVLGAGQLTDEQQEALTEPERRRLAEP